jgi:hypothetical protein
MSEQTKQPDRGALAQRLRQDGPQPGEWYRHFRGGNYLVVDTVVSEADLSLLVVYGDPETGYAWARPLEEWFGPASMDRDKVIRRFTQIEGAQAPPHRPVFLGARSFELLIKERRRSLTCVFCDYVAEGLSDLKTHCGTCPKHPLQERVAKLKEKLNAEIERQIDARKALERAGVCLDSHHSIDKGIDILSGHNERLAEAIDQIEDALQKCGANQDIPKYTDQITDLVAKKDAAIDGLAARVHAQGELLRRRAEKGGGQ